MTGTERAALRLALGMCRGGAFLDRVHDVLWIGGALDLADAVDGARCQCPRQSRAIRARVALYLRAVLRAEAGITIGNARCSKRGRGMPCTCWPGYRDPLWSQVSR